MKVACLLYPTAKLKASEDSSFWVLRELKIRGHEVVYFESKDLFWKNSSPQAFVRNANLDLKKAYLPSPLSASPLQLDQCGAILIRKEPPFDQEYLYSLQILNLLNQKIAILNNPSGIAIANEKMIGLEFPDLCPKSVISSQLSVLGDFLRYHKICVLKPLNHKAGIGIRRVRLNESNWHRILLEATHQQTIKVIMQEYLPVENVGDKRVFMVNGKVLGSFLRRPKVGEFRANLSLGGSMHPCTLTESERQVMQKISKRLQALGLYWVGVDMIDGKISEINVTSPSGIPELNELYGLSAEKNIADLIERLALKKLEIRGRQA